MRISFKDFVSQLQSSDTEEASAPPPPPPPPPPEEKPLADAFEEAAGLLRARTRTLSQDASADTFAASETDGFSALSTKTAQATGPSTASTPEARAAEDAARVRTLDDGELARAALADLERNKSNPAYVAAYVSQLKQKAPGDPLGVYPTPLDRAVRAVFTEKAPPFTSAFTEKDRTALIGALDTARSKGTLHDVEVARKVPQDSRTPPPKGEQAEMATAWTEVAKRMGIEPAKVYARLDTAVRDVTAAKVQVDQARAKVDALNEKLAQELAPFGAALTDAQRVAYVEAFRNEPENKKIYAAELTALNTLSTVMTNKGPDVVAAATFLSSGKPVVEALRVLADSPNAAAALKLGQQIQNTPEARQAFSQYNLQDTVFAPALPHAGAQLALQKDSKAAEKELRALLDPWKGLVDSKFDITAGIGALVEARKGNTAALARFVSGPDFKAVKTGWAALGALYAFTAIPGAEGGAKVKAFLEGTKNSLDVASAIMEATAKQGGKAAIESAERFANFAGRMGGVLGVVTGMMSASAHLDAPSGNGKKLALLGDGLSVLGATAAVLGSGGAAAVLAGLGAGLAALGDLLISKQERAALQKSQDQHLLKAGIKDPELRKTLINTDPERMSELASTEPGKGLGIPPERLQQLATTQAELFLQRSPVPLPLEPIMDLRQKFGMDGNEVFKLFQRVEAHADHPTQGINFLSFALSHSHITRKEDIVPALEAIIANHAGSTNVDDINYRNALQSAVDYLEKDMPAERNRRRNV
jgi:hypothetical protein